ncbi:MAG: YmfQ family protein [Proteobacteria bacterium]|nr:YmfQ family protein [Pseudomonadota bacterium]
MFLKVFKHLLPNSPAWRITIDKKLRQFFDGLSVALGDESKEYFDGIFTDIDPQKTRHLDTWETQFGLRDTGQTEQERRDRLAATWRAVGGQDPHYIQTTLQDAGFDVYVHDWWVPGTEPAVNVKSCVAARDPRVTLRDSLSDITYIVECDEAVAECGEAIAQAGERSDPPGYPLVNKLAYYEKDILPLCGETFMEAGETAAICGDYLTYYTRYKFYEIPADADKWHYFIYIGGAVYGEAATVDSKRKDEFESLCLKICPSHLWLGIIVEYN